ncbi:MAG: sulfurtransferase TusA family protein [Dethiobacteria bacterium]
MSETIDVRGLSCPEPVIITRNVLQKTMDKSAVVLVSSSVARDNVTRAARSLGWKVIMEEDGDGYKLNLTK